MNELEPNETISAPYPDLQPLVAEIIANHETGQYTVRRGVQHFVKAGSALLEAKQQVPHGSWLKWLEDNVPFSGSLAHKYMKLAKFAMIASLAGEELVEKWRIMCGNAPPRQLRAESSALETYFGQTPPASGSADPIAQTDRQAEPGTGPSSGQRASARHVPPAGNAASSTRQALMDKFGAWVKARRQEEVDFLLDDNCRALHCFLSTMARDIAVLVDAFADARRHSAGGR